MTADASILPTEDDYDDMHHALGIGGTSFRNHYCCPTGSEKAQRCAPTEASHG
jgi:hypothetical protein